MHAKIYGSCQHVAEEDHNDDLQIAEESKSLFDFFSKDNYKSGVCLESSHYFSGVFSEGGRIKAIW